MSIQSLVKRLPHFWRYSPYFEQRFPGSKDYWEERYATGGSSGRGSYGNLAAYKAEVLNDFVETHRIASVIEFGCGDGNQLTLARYPKYVGLDVSRTAIAINMERFKHDASKSFFLYDPLCFCDRARRITADLSMSLDVLYHLIEQDVFETHLAHLFNAAERFVIIYSSNFNETTFNSHVRNRLFTAHVEKNFHDWTLIEHVPNKYPFSEFPEEGTHADFFIYGKR